MFYNPVMARPCLNTTRQFRRVIGDDERAILLSAGQGDLTRGFYLLLDIYAHIHNQGFRPGDDLASIHQVTNENELSIALDDSD